MSLNGKLFVFTWIHLMVFMILLALKLEEKVQFLWFYVFIPLLLLLTLTSSGYAFKVILRLSRGASFNSSLKQYVFLSCVKLLEILLIVLSCLKLDNIMPSLRWIFIFIPLWVVILANIGSFVYYEIRVLRRNV